MGKVLLAIAFVAVAVIAPEVIPGLIGVAAGSLAAIAVTAAVEIGISLAANALLGPSTPKGLGKAVNNQVQRLFVTMETTAPRKIVFGDTAGATDLRYQSYTDGSSGDQRYYQQIIAVASHQCNSIYEDWFDNEVAWKSSGGVQGRYVGFLTVDPRTLGSSSNAIAIDSTWTSTCRLTGCAYVHLKFDLLGNATDGSNNSPFASGVTSRVTLRTQGAFLYDPRLDSTVSGGSGSLRATDQTTWVAAGWTANRCRNPALQLLFYLLGWRINNKLAVGMGLPSSRIDLASFAVAANACDESIALNGGGTEPRYRSDGVVTESDDRQSVIEAMCATMNAVLRDAGGKLSLTVLHNDLSAPIASFTEADILSDEKWEQTPDISSMFNICRGRHVDPSDKALYQLVETPEASLASTDGIDRIDTMDMPFVQSNGQAQRLLKQRLERKQYQGRYTVTGGPRWWQTSLGNVVQLSHAGLGWTSKLFRVASQSIVKTGECKLVLVEENIAIYAWDNSEKAAVTPGAATIYNPLNHPVAGRVGKALKTTGQLANGLIPLPMLAAGLRFFYNQSPTYAAAAGTPATATISLGSGTLTVGSRTVGYNAMSVNVTGTNGTNSTFYLYVDDSAYLGGAQTLQATTSTSVPYQNDGRIFMGQVTVAFPSSGTGSGSGTSGGGGDLGCPWAEAFVHSARGWIRARDIIPGDLVLALSEDRTRANEWATVTSNEIYSESCFVISGSGVRVTVSQSTPITLRDGSIITVAEIAGHELPFEKDGLFWWGPCNIEPVGELPVCKIKCGGKTYSAGDEPGAGILTHNPKP